ncbi:MAG: hypothetical protein QXP81_11215 [Nitrososphaerota archaeon]
MSEIEVIGDRPDGTQGAFMVFVTQRSPVSPGAEFYAYKGYSKKIRYAFFATTATAGGYSDYLYTVPSDRKFYLTKFRAMSLGGYFGMTEPWWGTGSIIYVSAPSDMVYVELETSAGASIDAVLLNQSAQTVEREYIPAFEIPGGVRLQFYAESYSYTCFVILYAEGYEVVA